MTKQADPMVPGPDEQPGLTSPLRAVTVSTGEPDETRRFYSGALGMTATSVRVEGAEAAELAALWQVAGREAFDFTLFTQPHAAAGGAIVRAFHVPGALPTSRPGYDSKYVGPLGFGFPVDDLHIRARIAEAVGYTLTAGVKQMDFPRADGTTYTVGEIHLLAPDDVMVLGVDRGDLHPVGSIDPALRIGQVGYASVLVSDIDQFGDFLRAVLGLTQRRKMAFEGGGPAGGMIGLDVGEKIAFEQWYSGNSSTGYLVVMQRLERERVVPQATGFSARGVSMWTFATTELDACVERFRARGGTAEVATVTSPGFGRGRCAIVHTPDGMPVGLIEQGDAM